jgi:hypothetical protein
MERGCAYGSKDVGFYYSLVGAVSTQGGRESGSQLPKAGVRSLAAGLVKILLRTSRSGWVDVKME